jgi:hypothetical protein
MQWPYRTAKKFAVSCEVYDVVFSTLDYSPDIPGMTAGRAATACEQIVDAILKADSDEQEEAILDAIRKITGNAAP